MRSVTSMTSLFIMLWLTAFVFASATSAGQPSITEGYPEPTILCVNHEVSTALVDVSMTPVYDWVHAGQQGISFTVTNKTNENLVVDWAKAFHPRRTAGEAAGGVDTLSTQSSHKELYDIVAPGATFSRTLWPRSSAPKAGRLENRSVYLTAATDKVHEQHEEIMLDVAGGNRICSR